MNSFLKQCWSYILQLTLARRPSDAVMIDHLSYGFEWYVDAPMRDCYHEVVALEQHGQCTNCKMNVMPCSDGDSVTGGRVVSRPLRSIAVFKSQVCYCASFLCVVTWSIIQLLLK